MSDLPFSLVEPELAARLDACLDVEGKIPRALEALGPVAGREVLLVGADGDRRAAQIRDLGARVRALEGPAGDAVLDADSASAEAVVGLWSTFRAPCPIELADADRVLRPGGRVLVVHDYGRDDVARLRGELPEHGAWSRRDGWYLANGFRIRVIHCFWTFAAIDDARGFLADAFGAVGATVGAGLRRPRLTYNVAVYHRTRGGVEAAS
jgi:hypothetical protein